MTPVRQPTVQNIQMLVEFPPRFYRNGAQPSVSRWLRK